MNVYETQRIVKEEDLDQYNHVNNVVYVQWIQDIADEHWKYLVKDNPDPSYLWFVVRHEIDYKRQAKFLDVITVRTWVGKTEGVTSHRHVEIFCKDVLLVKSVTTFCLVDAISNRPKRITEDIRSLLMVAP